MPSSYARFPLSQTPDRAKNRLAVFAVKLRESFKAFLSDKDDWPTSYYSELLLDTLLEDLSSTEVKDLAVWYGRHEVQEQVYSVSCKITTDDKFLQNTMRSVEALPAQNEANLESINGRSAEFFKTSVLYARRKLTCEATKQGNASSKHTVSVRTKAPPKNQTLRRHERKVLNLAHEISPSHVKLKHISVVNSHFGVMKSENYQWSTEWQRCDQILAPALVMHSGVFSGISKDNCYQCWVFPGSAPQRISTSNGKKSVSQ